MSGFRLKRLPFFARCGLTCLVGVILIGMWASLEHLKHHHGAKDAREGVSMEDLTASYHGVQTSAPLQLALDRGHPDGLADADRDALLAWIVSDDAVDTFDDLEAERPPAVILDEACLSCHARSSGDAIAEDWPLDYWEDVEAVMASRNLEPTPRDILIVSTHTHALSLATLSLALGALILATRWWRFIRSTVCGVMGAALLADIGAWWLARDDERYVWVVLAAGAAYSASIALGSAMVLIDLWLPGGRGKED